MRRASLAVATAPLESAPAGTEPASPIRVELHRALDVSAADAVAWQALIERRPETGVFVSPEWLSGYFAEPPAGTEPALALLRDGAGLRGIVPLGISAGRTHVRIALLGGGIGSDRVDLLAERGYEPACADALLASLERLVEHRAFVLELRDVPASSALWGAIHRAGLERTIRFALLPRDVHAAPYLDLARPAALDASSTAALRSIAKHRRMLERRCGLHVDLLHDEPDVDDAYGSLASFLHLRWRGRDQQSVLDEPRAFRFHQRVLPRLLRAGRLRMIRLSTGTRTVAVFYGLAAGSWWGYYLAGYDREWAGRIHLGRVTLALSIEQAARHGAVEFDFLKGAERTKYLWPVLERAAIDADVFSHRTGAQLTRAARSCRDVAAALAKSARHLFSA